MAAMVGPGAEMGHHHHHAPGVGDAKRISEGVNEEYHDPYDDWSCRDLVLAIMPFVITYALQDAAFRTGLVIALALTGFLLIMRMLFWDSRRKKIWPVLELIQLPLYGILLGLSYVNYYQVNKWYNIIAPLTLVIAFIISLAIRRPFTAHYARYPKFDRGGTTLFQANNQWRKTSDIATTCWIIAFSVMLLLSLAPILTGHHYHRHALNIIFNYVVPFVLILAALLATLQLGHSYRKKTVRDLDRYFGRTAITQEAYPAGHVQGGMTPATQV